MNVKIFYILTILFLPLYCYAYSQTDISAFKYGDNSTYTYLNPMYRVNNKIDKSSNYEEFKHKSSKEDLAKPNDMQFRDLYADNNRFPNFCTIEKINRDKLEYGSYYIEGYVAEIYTCPPCEEGVQCKKCMQDNIVVSSRKKFLEGYNLTDEELIVFVDDIEQFEVGKKYLMLIKILNVKTTTQMVNNIKMIYYKEM